MGRQKHLVEKRGKSRLGVGNSLYGNVTAIKRILRQVHDAFYKFDNLLDFALKQDKSQLELITLAQQLSYWFMNVS
jgi:hypothetical protein